jgi:hypothetical protein
MALCGGTAEKRRLVGGAQGEIGRTIHPLMGAEALGQVDLVTIPAAR